MEKKTAWNDKLGTCLIGAAIGAAAMYLSDPVRGVRRRAMVRDKIHHLKMKTAASIGAAARNLSNRMKGMRARYHSHILSHSSDASRPSDPDIVIARMRAKMGRYVSNPHSIDIKWQDGRHVLSGPILAHEKDRLIAALHMTSGAGEIEDRLQVHEKAEGIPGLQGTHEHRSPSPELHSIPALHGVAMVAGGLLAAYSLMHRTPRNFFLGITAAALLTRGAVNKSLKTSEREAEKQGSQTRQASESRNVQERYEPPLETAPLIQPPEHASRIMH